MISNLVLYVNKHCGERAEDAALAVFRLEEEVAAHRALVAAALELVAQRDREASVKDDRIQALREEIRRYVSAVVEPDQHKDD